MNASNSTPAFLGLRTAIYAAPDLAKATTWYSEVLGFQPYFNQPFYVGFNVGGFELGLDPNAAATGAGGVSVYWGVANAAESLQRLLTLGAKPHADVQEVGEGIRVATVLDPFGNVFGIIENPHFNIPHAAFQSFGEIDDAD
jgi:predicted enzyme related to lactoylglutathione lyase